jgi:plasmid stabilization system protein ParE
MHLRWSKEAVSDLERITNYLFEETPQHAPELVRAIYKAPSALLTFPHRGRPRSVRKIDLHESARDRRHGRALPVMR